MSGDLIILGAGGHAKVVAELAQLQGWVVQGFFDPALPADSTVLGLPLLEKDPFDRPAWMKERAFFVAIGDNDIRWREFRRLIDIGVTIPTLVHPTAIVSPSATIGAGSVVMAGAVVQSEARVGEAAVINTSASIDHDCAVKDGAFIGPGAILCGHVSVAEHAFVGAGSIVMPKAEIGIHAFVKAGTRVCHGNSKFAKAAIARSTGHDE
ncbi:hypothetical protein GR183_11730 [Stappia sp. GBMRC 2046]|uniref:PglD N-terminal domain-containing protein n=1 Tax=Stappia sediminis TaxID=2692190 RepID=A0A7X3LV04_9HYPH|nr:acetyltransferase [Stappia sediminis]MXN65573.1 hypothetical protein [Stappia sediminis]